MAAGPRTLTPLALALAFSFGCPHPPPPDPRYDRGFFTREIQGAHDCKGAVQVELQHWARESGLRSDATEDPRLVSITVFLDENNALHLLYRTSRADPNATLTLTAIGVTDEKALTASRLAEEMWEIALRAADCHIDYRRRVPDL